MLIVLVADRISVIRSDWCGKTLPFVSSHVDYVIRSDAEQNSSAFD